MEQSRQDIQKLTVVQLKDKLREAGLKLSGRKADLVDRLYSNQTPVAFNLTSTEPEAVDTQNQTVPNLDEIVDQVDSLNLSETAETSPKYVNPSQDSSNNSSYNYQTLVFQQELSKLEELYSSGFIVAGEYEQRKTALQDSILESEQNPEPKIADLSSKPIDIPTTQQTNKILENIEDHVAQFYSSDPEAKLAALATFRRLSSTDSFITKVVQQIVDTGVVPEVINCLSDSKPEVLFEAAWLLTNVASSCSEHTKLVIEATSTLVGLLSMDQTTSPVVTDVIEQSIWCLGNIAGDSVEARNYVLENNAMEAMLQVLETSARVSVLRNTTWAVSNLCRGKPSPPFDSIKVSIPAFARLLFSDDEEVLTDTCWALSYLSDGADSQIEAVIKAGVCKRICELLSHSSHGVKILLNPILASVSGFELNTIFTIKKTKKIVVPALRVVGNIATGDDHQTTTILNPFLPEVKNLLSQPKENIIKETLWTVSNVAAGSRQQIQAIIDAGFIPMVIKFLSHENMTIVKEAAWTIGNLTSGGSDAQLSYLYTLNVIAPLATLLSNTAKDIQLLGLEGIQNLLAVADRSGNFDVIEEIAAHRGEIEKLENHTANNLRTKAIEIVDRLEELC